MFQPPPESLTYPAEIKRLVIFGDPHGDHAGLDAVVAREASPETAFASVGDNVGYSSGSVCSEFVRRLQALNVRSVQGNHEDWLSEGGRLAICLDRSDRELDAEVTAWAKALPRQLLCRFAAAPGLRLLLTHTLDARPGMKWPYVDRSTVHRVGPETEAEVVVFGHTHAPCLYTPAETGWREARLDLQAGASLSAPLQGRVFADAGSLARPAHRETGEAYHLATYLRLDLEAEQVTLQAVAKEPAARP